jgi:HlyD family secretion protein
MKFKFWGATLLVGGAVIGGLYASGRLPTVPWIGSSSPASEPVRVPVSQSANAVAPAVSVVAVSSADFIETVLITGSVIARDEILITPEIEGFRVEELFVEEGARVEKGQLLARLASETLEAQLAKNDADAARANAAIAVARSGIVQVEASVKEATNAFDRVKPLKEQGYASGATFDQRESAASTAAAKLISARDSLKSAEADKAAFEAARRELSWRRSKTEIRATVDGLVSRRSARVGSVASAASDPIFRIIARGEVELDAEVAESDVHKVHEGQVAMVMITGLGDVSGTVRLISGEVDRATRLGKVKIFLGVNPDIRLGAFGRGTIVTAKSRGLAVPTAAVTYGADGARVLVVADGKVQARRVKIGLKTVQSVEITEGLAERDMIVAKAGSFLRDGDTVRPIVADAKVSGTSG